MAELRFGIIGTGMIADVHAKAIRDCTHARLAAVHDLIPERAHAFGSEHGIEAETDLQTFLARPDIDAVTIATPSGAHADVAVPAAEAGKHVLCEKPMEVTVERADRIIRACRANHVTLGCVFQARTNKNVQRIRQALEAGRFGRLILADVQVKWFRSQQYYDSAGWRGTWRLDGGGALMNQSIHVIDLLLHLAGPPRAVYAFSDTLTHNAIEVEDTAAACIRFANGAMGVIEATTCCAPGFPRRLELSGERGSVVLEDDRLARWQFADQSDADDRILAQGTAGDDLKSGAGDPKARGHEGHRRQIQDFTDAILADREPMIPGREGRRAVELICGIYTSAQTGQAYHFPPV